jgi:hypothetical protein
LCCSFGPRRSLFEVDCGRASDVRSPGRTSGVGFGPVVRKPSANGPKLPGPKAQAIWDRIVRIGFPAQTSPKLASEARPGDRSTIKQPKASLETKLGHRSHKIDHPRPEKGVRPFTLEFLIHGFGAGRKSSIFGVWAPPAAPKTIPDTKIQQDLETFSWIATVCPPVVWTNLAHHV